MIFITPEDLDAVIQEDDLSIITGQNPGIVDDAETIAIEEAAAYLRSLYNSAQAFAATGSARNPKLVQVVMDILLYHVHSRISPRNIPDLRVKRYDDALQYLRMCQKGDIQPDLPVIAGQKDFPIASGHHGRWHSNMSFGGPKTWGGEGL